VRPVTKAQEHPRNLRYAPLAAGLALLIAAARVAATLYAMREAPYYDQWAGIDGIALPRAAHAFDPSYLFQPHNEHLMVWTKLLDWLQLVATDNQYDARPVGILLAVLSAVVAGLLLAGGACRLKKGRNAWLCAGLALVAIPYSWESLSVTWNNAFVFLIAGAAATLWLAAQGTRAHVMPMLAAATLSVLAMGTGWLAPLMGIGIVAYRVMRRELPTADAAALAFPQIAAMVLAWLLLAGKMHSGDPRPIDATLVLAQLALLTTAFVPTGLMLAQIFFGTDADSQNAAAAARRQTDMFIAALALWGYLHVVSMIVLRSEFRLWLPISRYMDVIVVAIMANLACWLRLRASGLGRLLSWIAVPAVVSFAVITVLAAPLPLYFLQWRADRLRQAEALIAVTVRDHDTTAIARADSSILPFPDRAYLETKLADENVRHILGDRVGSRTESAAFVRASRDIERAMTDHGIALSIATIALASMLLVFARRSASNGAETAQETS